ncbi:hypothetical protein [Legionella londiniensis]|nr:hypothetical protein [Legionella londiniensis]
MIAAGCLASLLASCSSYYTSNGENVYLRSGNGPDLIVPPPLTDTNISYFYNLPAQRQNPQVNIEPPQG